MVIIIECNNQQQSTGTTVPFGDLEKTRWGIESLSGISSDSLSLPKPVYIQLDSGMLKGFAGCNSLFGSYAQSGDSLHFEPVGSTKMFCNQGMEVENLLVQALHNTRKYSIRNEKLELLAGDSLLARFGIMQPEEGITN